ncbi:hypothetical protein L3X38_024354 [Prunus dulcis]|uniref:Uncharacterized protein n=1 Tax=Prunus dulcis TaxID=3755 RepID=A0AAD4Z6C3_PRUDU|nr:hypothetical protein L3X38_024354 [Prunus dulcis]
MMDFKGEKVEDMAVMAEEWLGWPLECLQQLNGGRKVVWWLLKGVDGCWDACNSRVKGGVGTSLFPVVKREH